MPRRALTAIIVTLTALSVTAVASASESEELAARDKITSELAGHDLAVQRSEPQIAEHLQASMGGCYGGVWFNNKSGYFMVNLPPGCPKASAETGVGRAGIARYPLAKYTWTQLQETDARLTAELHAYIAKQQAQVGITTNVVKVTYASTLTAEQKSQIKTMSSTSGAISSPLNATTMARASTTSGPECSFPYCLEEGVEDVIGGGRIGAITFSGHCTTGFLVFSGSTMYALDAGHCGEGETEPWVPGINYSTSCKQYLAAYVFAPEVGDAALRTVGGCRYAPDVQDWQSGELLRVAHRVRNYSCIGGVKCTTESAASEEPFKGLMVCHSGATIGTRCGEVTATDMTIAVRRPEGAAPWVMPHLASFCAPVMPGDSGGPTFARTVPLTESEVPHALAVGIVTAGYYNVECGSYAEEIGYTLGLVGAVMP